MHKINSYRFFQATGAVAVTFFLLPAVLADSSGSLLSPLQKDLISWVESSTGIVAGTYLVNKADKTSRCLKKAEVSLGVTKNHVLLVVNGKVSVDGIGKQPHIEREAGDPESCVTHTKTTSPGKGLRVEFVEVCNKEKMTPRRIELEPAQKGFKFVRKDLNKENQWQTSLSCLFAKQ